MRVLSAVVILLCLFSLLPLALIVLVSLTSAQFAAFPPPGYSLRWYVEALRNDEFRTALLYSVGIAVAVSSASVLLGAPAAYALARMRFSGRDLVLGTVMSPLLIAHVVIGIALLDLFSAFSLPLAPYALFAGHLLITLPFVVRLLVASLLAIPLSHEWASESLGASRLQTFLRALLPQVAPAAAAAVVLVFLVSFDEVNIALFMQSPGRVTLPAVLFNYAQGTSDPVAIAASGTMIAISALVVLILDRQVGLLGLLLGDVPSPRPMPRG